MASQQSSGKVLCKYFSSNCCFKGDLCPFSHDWKHKPDMRCRYYMKGLCSNGKNCRYDHVKEEEFEESTNHSTHVGRSASTVTKGGVSHLRAAPVGTVRPTYVSPLSRAAPVGTVSPSPVSPLANLPSLSSTGVTTSTGMASHRKMVTLHDDPTRNPKKWAKTPEFVPGKQFYGHVDEGVGGSVYHEDEGVGGSVYHEDNTASSMATYSGVLGYSLGKFLDVITPEEASSLLCPFAEMGHCPFEKCEYLHGNVCDMCNRQCLNPFDIDQQKAHRKECLIMHEMEMEKAFQIQESVEKQCAICMETIVSKSLLSERRFGILANCDHCFCLPCIRKWRGSAHAQNKTIRACPLCRKISYYVIPSEVWIDDEDQKKRLMQNYKDNLGKKHCKYFNMGEGTCPFGFSCFYKHEFPDGRKAEDIPRYYEDCEGERRAVKTSTLWDFLNNREENRFLSTGGVDSTNEGGNEISNSDQELFWLNFEPEIDELDFL